MSNQPERAEKTCLNCHAELVGRFCHVCGQENIVTKQDFWSLLKHFIYDVFHFDGKFFDTLKYLLFYPGKVPKEYTTGKRASFLDPIRMYLFTSAVFFLVFYATNNMSFTSKKQYLTPQERKEELVILKQYAKDNPKDLVVLSKIAILEDSTRPVKLTDILTGMPFQINGRFYRNVSAYDSTQKTLHDTAQDGAIKRLLTRKLIHLHSSKDMNAKAAETAFFDDFVHKFPYMLFISLPFFAAILKLLYLRRKHLFYSDHAIFTIYHYIISFILLLFIIGLVQLDDMTDWYFIRFFGYAIAIWWVIYLFLSLKRFYGQSWGKTFLKYLILSVTASIFILLLFFLFIFITAYQL